MTEMRWADPFGPDGELSGNSIYPDADVANTERWAVLRLRWEDQLRLVAPDVWRTLVAELGPVEAQHRQLAESYNLELSNAGSHANALRHDLETMRTKLANSDKRQRQYDQERQEARRERDLAVADAVLLAEQVQALASMLAATKEGERPDWHELVSEEVGASVHRHIPIDAEIVEDTDD